MDTTSIRNFAVAARERLLKGVDERLNALGFAADGTVPEEYRPSPVSGGVLFRGAVMSDTSFFPKWTALEADVKKLGRTAVRDEVAYTWFNRFCAIRILAKRQFIPVALEYVGNRDSRTPALVAAMRAGEALPPLLPQERADLEKIRLDDTKTTEQFAILVTAFCRNTPVIAKCFDIKHGPSAADYLSMLLPRDILSPGGFVDALNDAEKISDADYCADELIGWLYQYYISERKQEVFDGFKDGKKAAPEDIPAATQIFTPNWIVKYMVQNSLGRLAIENGLGGSFTDGWQYLIREEDGTHPPCLKVDSPEEFTFADVACGSGHILLEGFRHLLQIYIEAGYSNVQAVELILSKNVFGIDLDIRARQLSQFALLLAAMTVDPSFADAHVMPRVLDMEGTLVEGEYHRAEIATVLAVQDDAVITELQAAFALLTQANNLGSIMKFKISANTRGILAVKVAELEAQPDDLARKYLPSFRLILALTDQYAAIVTNPPYMGSGNMNAELAEYVKANYPDGKADLFAVFIRLCLERCHAEGIVGMITMQSWMFLSSFEKLRCWILGEKTILSMAHLGARAFDAIGGEVVSTTAFTLRNGCHADYRGWYLRLVDGQSEAEKEALFHRVLADKMKGNFFIASAEDIKKIPGAPVAYWVNDPVSGIFKQDSLGNHYDVKAGMCTGDNARFICQWWEVDFKKSSLSTNNYAYVPHNKGGEFRRWYGNRECFLKYSPASLGRMEKCVGFRHDGKEFYFRDHIGWSKITSGHSSFRLYEDVFTFDSAGLGLFPKNGESLTTTLAFLNSKVAVTLIEILNPTLNVTPIIVKQLPYSEKDGQLEFIVKRSVALSRADWNAYATSWDFTLSPLVAERNNPVEKNAMDAVGHAEELPQTLRNANDASAKLEFLISDLYAAVRQKWVKNCVELRKLEMENNRIFIEAYGLTDEMKPDVPWSEISLTCNPWYRYGEKNAADGDEFPLDETLEKKLRTDTIKELVSYAVGCLMGRYSLDKEGLILASQGETLEEYWQKVGVEKTAATLQPDDDGILPVIVGTNAFADDAKNRVTEFVRVVFGAENLNANLNFIEECLGTTLESYLAKEFWKDHKKMYQNRPIYWLFSSKKGAFQCLVYMHRMDAYTATKVRNDYLLKHIEFLRTRIAADTARSADLSAQERRDLKKMQQALEECLEYDGRLHVVADRMQPIDLDDGVVVNYAKFGDVLAKLK